MLNNIYQDLINSNPKDVLVFADFDDCLALSTVRNLTSEQKQILWDLHHLTDGGFIITTNSDGRSIFEMPEMDGYPVISEYSTTFRNVKGINTIVNFPMSHAKQPNSKAAFNAAAQAAKDLGIKLVDTGEELKRTVGIKLEEKEQGIAAVFGSHTQLADNATKIIEHAFKIAGISSDTHEIDYTGKDAREIKVKGAKKSDVIDHLQSLPLMQRKLIVGMGDSGTDWEVMRRVGNGIVVGHAISDDKLDNINHIRLSATQTDFSNSWNLLRAMRDSYQSKTRQVLQSRHVRTG